MTLDVPRTAAGKRAIAAVLDDPQGTLLATDFDGVLAPIVPDPGQAHADDAAMSALGRLGRHLGQIAVITGRGATTAVRLGQLRGRPGLDRLVVLGQYGVERWDAATDELHDPPPPDGVAAMARELPELLAELGVADALVEDKGRARVIHTRRLPDPADALRRLTGPVTDMAARHGLTVEPGKNVLEIRAPGQDKGKALRELATEADARTVVYIGDDLGDLPAFAAVREFQEDGREALGICSASVEEDALVDVSDVVVDGVPGVAAWLAGLADELDRRSASTA